MTPHLPVAIGVMGLITSIPPKDASKFDPLAEFGDESELTDKTGFEKGVRAMFGSLDELEEFVRYTRYPNITVHPIAVFRHFEARET